MFKKKYFLLVCICIASTLCCQEETTPTPPEPTPDMIEEVMEEIVEAITNNELDDTPQVLEEMLEESNAAEAELAGILEDMIDNMVPPPPPPPTEEDLRISFWDKLKMFWSFPMAMKWELFTDHIKDHKIGYTIGSGLTIATGIALTMYCMRNKKNEKKE